MRRMMSVLAAMVLAIGFVGCARDAGTRGVPCEQCENGYVTTGKHTDRKVGCIANGKVVDCKKNPAECPECAKAAQNK